MDSLRRFVAAMPKVELHVHLEGAIAPATLLELARRRRIALPADDEAGLREWFRFRDFEHFVEVYLACSRCLLAPEDFQLAARRFMESQARQNVVHTEAHFTISTHLANGANGREVGEALGETLAEGERDLGVRLRLIPDIVRNAGLPRSPSECYRRADATLEWALEHRPHGVVALGLSGIERFPAEPFREHFRAAAAEGLRRVAHAGEQEGAESIRDALAVCAPERLGHGIRALDDPELVATLHERRLPLEVCPGSNLALGYAADLAAHPLRRMLEAGLEVSIHSDDPALFDTDLSGEYLRAAEACGLEAPGCAALSLAALRHAFLEPAERRRLEADFRRRFAELGEELLERPVEPAESPLPEAAVAGFAGGRAANGGPRR